MPHTSHIFMKGLWIQTSCRVINSGHCSLLSSVSSVLRSSSFRLADEVDFAWTTPGVKIITATTSNSAGTISATQHITLTALPAPVALQIVSISGPLSEKIDRGVVFTATVAPLSTTLPITLTWQATGQSAIVQSGILDLQASYKFTWTLTGTKTVTDTASNLACAAISVTSIKIEQTWRVYLPLVIR